MAVSAAIALTHAKGVEMQIRNLKTKDMLAVIGMLMKVGGGVRKELARMIVSRTSQSSQSSKKTSSDERITQMVNIALTVLTACYENVYDDFIEWLASLCGENGVTVAEYNELPVETTLDLIDQLANAEDTQRFFSRVWQLFNRMNRSAAALNARLDQSNTITESEKRSSAS